MAGFRATLPSARVTAAGGAILTIVPTVIVFDTATYQRGPSPMWDSGAPDRLTADRPGLYYLLGQGSVLPNVLNDFFQVIVDKNGSSVSAVTARTGGALTRAQASALVELAEGDTVQLRLQTAQPSTMANGSNLTASRLGPKRWTGC